MIIQSAHQFRICSVAALVEPDGVRAWAERHVRKDPDLRWIVGNYVEADEANSNGHIFPLDELVAAQHTLVGKPLNMMHRDHYIVGAFAGAQLLTPEGTEIERGDVSAAAAMSANGHKPYVEALAMMWHRRFPEEFFNIRRAHSEGTLFYSMEVVPQEVSCPTCSHRAAFAGMEHASYCDHMQGALGPKRLHNPTFSGGAIIIPPVKPGWSRADVTAIAKYVEEQSAEAEHIYEETKTMASHLGAPEWESLMGEIISVAVEAKEFSPETRRRMAKEGSAMPDGSFPINSRQDVQNAIQAIGRAKDPAAAKQHIKKMARKLGCEELIPEGW